VKRAGYVTACVTAALLDGCSLAPKYRPPPPPDVSSYKEAGDWMPAKPADAQPRGPWWESFGDPTLSQLEGQLAESNPDLQAAVARTGDFPRALIEQARRAADVTEK